MSENREVLHGIGVSIGNASGPVATVRPAIGVDTTEPACVDVDADKARVQDALAQVVAGLTARAATAPAASKPILEDRKSVV